MYEAFKGLDSILNSQKTKNRKKKERKKKKAKWGSLQLDLYMVKRLLNYLLLFS
jgi:hypothetical protein